MNGLTTAKVVLGWMFVLSLLSLGGRDAIPSLVERMRDEDESVRKAARRSLAGLCGDDAGGSYYAWKRYLEENHE